MSELSYMKNIPGEEVLELAAMVEAGPGQVVSRTLAQNPAVSVTLFAFAKGEEISTHQSEGDAMVTVLEGTGWSTWSKKGRPWSCPPESPTRCTGRRHSKCCWWWCSPDAAPQEIPRAGLCGLPGGGFLYACRVGAGLALADAVGEGLQNAV